MTDNSDNSYITLSEWATQQQQHTTATSNDNNTTQDINRISSLYRWLINNQSNQSTIHNSVTLQYNRQYNSIGVYTTTDIPYNSVLLTIQSDLFLLPVADKDSPLYNVSSFTSLVLNLLHIYNNKQHKHYDYIHDTLPTVYHNAPYTWSRKQRKVLDGCVLNNSIEYSDTEHVYDNNIQYIHDKHNTTYGDEQISYQLYMYMVCTVMSRAFDRVYHRNKQNNNDNDNNNNINNTTQQHSMPVIVPLADMLNTSTHIDKINCFVEWHNNTFILKTKQDIKANTEFLIEYSSQQMSHSDTLRRYGFIEYDNNYCYIDISIDDILLLNDDAADDDDESDDLDNDKQLQIIQMLDKPYITISSNDNELPLTLYIVIAVGNDILSIDTLHKTIQQQQESINALSDDVKHELDQTITLVLLQRLSYYTNGNDYNNSINNDTTMLKHTDTEQWKKSYYNNKKHNIDDQTVDLYRLKCGLITRINEQKLIARFLYGNQSNNNTDTDTVTNDNNEPLNKRHKH